MSLSWLAPATMKIHFTNALLQNIPVNIVLGWATDPIYVSGIINRNQLTIDMDVNDVQDRWGSDAEKLGTHQNILAPSHRQFQLGSGWPVPNPEDMVEIPAEDSDKSDKSDSDSETESQPTEFSVVMDTVVCWENAIPKELLSIKPAGSGSFGKVFYCIPRDALEDYPNIAKQPTKKLPGSLKAQICAVKVHSATTMVEQAWAEAEILKYIQQADEFPGRHLSRLLAANIPATGLSTITMEAVMGPTLDHFWNSYMGRFDSQWMPKEFVWHVFLQLGAAIRFIHSMNVSHNDLHDGNVMLNMARQDFPGLPNVVLIDFGQANHFETEARNPFRTKPAVPAEKIELLIEDDNAAFFQILYALSMGIVDREDSWDWHTFTALLEDSAYGFGSRGQSDAQKCVLDKMTTRYEAPAIAERAKISQKAKENIARHLSVVTVVRSLGLSDDEIRSAVVAELDKA